MARLSWQGSPFNAAQITQLYLVDVNGEEYDFLGCLGGDLAINSAKIAQTDVSSRQFVVATLDGKVEAGSISLPMIVRNMTANNGGSIPSLMDVLAQNNYGTVYVPWQAVSLPAVGNLPATVIYSTSNVKTWKFIIIISTTPIDGSPYATKIEIFASVMTPDVTVGDAGSQATMTITGGVKDPRALVWSAV